MRDASTHEPRRAGQAEIVYLRQSRIIHTPMVRVDLSGGVTSPDPHIDRPNLVFAVTRLLFTASVRAQPSHQRGYQLLTNCHPIQPGSHHSCKNAATEGWSQQASFLMQLPCLPLNVGVPDATLACRTGLKLGYAARCTPPPADVPTACKPQAPGKVRGPRSATQTAGSRVPQPPQ